MLVALEYHSIYGSKNESFKVCDFTFFMQYFSFKLIAYVEIGLKNNFVFVSDVTVAREQSRNQVKLEFILWQLYPVLKQWGHDVHQVFAKTILP